MEDRVIGRDAELAVLDRFVVDTARDPAALVIAGEAGIGKSVLWESARRKCEARSHQVLAARPAELEAALPFAGLADLLEGVEGNVLAGLPHLQRSALEVALVGAADGDGRPVGNDTLKWPHLEPFR